MCHMERAEILGEVDSGEMEFLRYRLRRLADYRLRSQLSDDEEVEYAHLCDVERRLLAAL